MAYRQLPPRTPLERQYSQRMKQETKRKAVRADHFAQFGCSLVVTVWLTAVLFGSLCSQNNLGLAGLFIVIPVFIGCCYFLWRLLIPLFRTTKIGDPEVSLSNEILRVGEPFQFHFQQTVKAPLEIQSAQVTLLMRESATYEHGTTITTEEHETLVSQYRLPGRNFQAGDQLRLDHEFTIPPDGMHSFDGKHNKIEWLIRAEVTIPTWSDVKEEYDIQVLPAQFTAPER